MRYLVSSCKILVGLGITFQSPIYSAEVRLRRNGIPDIVTGGSDQFYAAGSSPNDVLSGKNVNAVYS